MGKRIFSFIIIIVLLFSFYTISLSYSQVKKIEAIEEQLLFKANDNDQLEISCLNVDGKIYIPITNLLKLIGGEIESKDDYILLRNYIDFPETDYLKGERFVYGTIQKVDYKKKEIIIEQHMDDDSIKVPPLLKVREDVVLIAERKNNRMNIDFRDLKMGDVVGLVLDKEGIVKGIILPL